MIPVSQLSFDEPITIQVFDHEVLASCNHDGAKEDIISLTNDLDVEEHFQALVCKCGAYKILTDDDREDWND